MLKLIIGPLLILGLLGGIWLNPATVAAMEPLPKLRAGTPPHSVVGNIMGANRQLLQGVSATATGRELSEAPHLIWLADPDHRVGPELVWSGQAGGIYTVRNLGHQVELAPGALDFGIRQLFSPILLITGHNDSETIRIFQEGYQHLGEAIRRELNHLHPALGGSTPAAKEAQSPEALARQHLRAVEANIDYQVARALERYGDRVSSGRLVVVGGLIDLANQHRTGPGRLFLININGETDPARLKNSPHLVRLTPEMRNYVGRRPAAGN